MHTAEISTTNQHNSNSLLHDSCAVYSEINALYKKLESSISGSPELIAEILSTINSKQNLVKDIDDRVNQSLQVCNTISDECKDLLRKREGLLQDTMMLNKAIAQKANARKSHLRHEVASLTTNRHAINGYKVPQITSKEIINRSF